jgi:SpoIID/LytB domain protein
MSKRSVLLLAGSAAAFLHASAMPVHSESSFRPTRIMHATVVSPAVRKTNQPLLVVPRSRDPVRVRGLHSYYGRLVVKPGPGGLVLVNRISLEQYLLGLDEVPRTWPAEALRTQAVAARTYALWTLDHPRGGASARFGFDICASTECQVFSGADVVGAPEGLPWARAVEDTAGRSVFYGGRPILARYHSTSGGRTFSNQRGFPGERSYPYLRSVPSTTETGSSLYRWKVALPLRHVETILRGAGWWKSSFGALVNVATERRPPLFNPDVVFAGTRRKVVHSADDFRTVAAELAPRRWPRLYPSPAQTASGRLPETLPSERYRVETRSGAAVFEGRGWGHGVGLSQWGAHGLALRGATYRDILSHYYPGTKIRSTDTGRPIAVGLAWGRRTVTVEGNFKVIDGHDRTIGGSAGGRWVFRDEGGSLSMRVAGHAAFGEDLRAVEKRPSEGGPRQRLARRETGDDSGPPPAGGLLLAAAGVVATGAVALWAVRMRR